MNIPSSLNIQENTVDKMVRDETSFYNIFNNIMSENLLKFDNTFFITNKKIHVFEYIHIPTTEESQDKKGMFVELKNDILKRFVDKFHFIICQKLFKWRTKYQSEMDDNSCLQDKYDKIIIKLMGVDRSKPETLSKFRKIIYGVLSN
jgi:hypothetical protein